MTPVREISTQSPTHAAPVASPPRGSTPASPPLFLSPSIKSLRKIEMLSISSQKKTKRVNRDRDREVTERKKHDEEILEKLAADFGTKFGEDLDDFALPVEQEPSPVKFMPGKSTNFEISEYYRKRQSTRNALSTISSASSGLKRHRENSDESSSIDAGQVEKTPAGFKLPPAKRRRSIRHNNVSESHLPAILEVNHDE